VLGVAKIQHIADACGYIGAKAALRISENVQLCSTRKIRRA